MTISVQNPINEYAGNGSAKTFSYTFHITANADLKVYLNGVLQVSGFTISGTGNQSGGSVVFTTAPASGVVVRLQRLVNLERTTDYQEGAAIPTNTLDRDFDRLWMASQDARVGTLALDLNGVYEAGNHKIVNVLNPTNAQDVATKGWVETALTSAVTIATAQAGIATTKAAEAAASATSIVASASTATTQAGIATTKAAEAETSASSASGSAASANNSASAAANSVAAATGIVGDATAQANIASTKAAEATTAKNNAAASAVEATASAAAALSHKNSSAASASAAATSEANAAAMLTSLVEDISDFASGNVPDVNAFIAGLNEGSVDADGFALAAFSAAADLAVRTTKERAYEFASVEEFRRPGYTDAQTIQLAVQSGKALDFPERTYIVGTNETVINDSCHVFRCWNTVFKIADGAIVNTNAVHDKHTAFMRTRGIQGFLLTGKWTIDGNRDAQTYPATTSDFGRGTNAIGSAGRRTNGVFEFTPGVDNATPCRDILIENGTVQNGYLNGLVFWQTEGVVVKNVSTRDNSVNGIAGGGVTNFTATDCNHLRDGASDAFPTSALPTGFGDRAGIQFREILSSFNAASIGMPMIPVTSYAQINRNVMVINCTAERCGVESWFLRACFPGKITGCVSRNVGYKRLDGVDSGGLPYFSPAHFWAEFGHYEIDVVAYQDAVTPAGWQKPQAGVCFSFSGDGYSSTTNPMAIAGDFRSNVKLRASCGLTSAGAKQNNFAKGLIICSFVNADVEIEGASDDPVVITNDTNHNLRPPHDVSVRAVVTNAVADCAVRIQRYQPTGVTVAGAANSIRISLKASDIRSALTGTDDHALIDMHTTMSNYTADEFEAYDLELDGTNSTNNFNGVRLRCNGSSKNMRVHFKRGVNLTTGLRTQGFRNLKLEGAIETALRTWLIDLSTTSVDVEEFDFSDLRAYDITTEMFLLQNTTTRKLKAVRANGALLKGRTACKTWGTGSITTTADSFAVELGKFCFAEVIHDYGSAAPATNVQDMRRTFSGAAALTAAVPMFIGEVVKRTDTSGVYIARSYAAGDFALMA